MLLHSAVTTCTKMLYAKIVEVLEGCIFGRILNTVSSLRLTEDWGLSARWGWDGARPISPHLVDMLRAFLHEPRARALPLHDGIVVVAFHPKLPAEGWIAEGPVNQKTRSARSFRCFPRILLLLWSSSVSVFVLSALLRLLLPSTVSWKPRLQNLNTTKHGRNELTPVLAETVRRRL